MEKLNVVIAEDNERILQILDDLLSSDEEIEVVGKAKMVKRQLMLLPNRNLMLH